MLTKQHLHGYQIEAYRHIINNHFCGLFMDMGLGKTVSTLTAIDALMYEDLEIDRVLVVAPKRVVENVWTSEVKKWSHLQHLRLERVIGSAAQRRNALKRKADIHLISRDNIAWLCGEFGGTFLPFDMLVVDESSSFKNHKSLRFKALRKTLASFKRRVILTGTPASNNLQDIWAQIFILDLGERLYRFISNYRKEFFRPGKTNGHIVYSYNLRRNSEERIYERIKDICISMKAEDYLDLPARVDNYVDIIFPSKLQRQYDEFEKEQVLELFDNDEDNISAANAAALSNKLLQFANGAVYDEDRVAHEVHKLKLEATEELIEQAQGRPVLIAYTYRHDLTRLQKHLKKYKPVKLEGAEEIDAWNAGRINVMLMHPASGGHGLNLQAGGSIIIWFGQTWSLELYQQFNARLHRQGQTRTTVINHLIARKTLDGDVVNALARKDQTQERLIQAVKLRRDRYLQTA